MTQKRRASRRSTTRGNSTGAPRRKSTSRAGDPRPASRWEFDAQKQAIILGIVLMGFSFVLLLSLASPNQGQLTAALSRVLRYALGWGGVVAPIALVGLGFYLVLWGMEQAPTLPRSRLLGLALLFLIFEAFATLVVLAMDNGLNDIWSVAAAETGGGYLGGLIVWPLLSLLGRELTVLLLMILGLVAAVLVFGVTRTDIRQAGGWLKEKLQPSPEVATDPPAATAREIPVNTGGSVRVNRPRPPLVIEPLPEEPLPMREANAPPVVQPEAMPAPARRGRAAKRQTDAPVTTPEPVASDPLFLAPNPDAAPAPNWKLPVMDDLLEAGSESDVDNSYIREQVEIIEHTLESFGAPAIVVEINQGPTVTQFGVEPQFIVQRNGKRTKVKVGKIAGLADDLALALAAHSVRVQAPVPGKGYVGLEIPNQRKTIVSLRDVMKSDEFTRIRSPLRLGLGQNVAGVPIAADLTKMPHLLIAGATGAGKSVCVNSIIACLLLQNTPEDLRLVMVDPKRVELTNYNGIPHLVAPVVVDMERVIGTLQWALREMDSRYKRLAEAGTRNIGDYNRKQAAKGEKKLPYIVVFIDELADLMMLSPEDTERGITRLAQMARATGIHMVIATQRPSVDVVTGLIKANFPARIAFAVASSTDSRVILDTVGAERLLGQGDMLFQSPDAGSPLRLQGCFLSDRELSGIIEYWRGARRFNLISAQDAQPRDSRTAPETPAAPQTTLPPPTQQPLWEDLIDEAEEASQYQDDLMPEAVSLVRQLNRASTSLLQRRFRIGYTRAARLMDIMEEEGIIGPPTGTSKAREVFPPSPDENGADAQEETTAPESN